MSEAQFYYDWDITKLESTAVVGDYNNVVTRVMWTMWGSDELGNRVPLYGETELSVESVRNGAAIENFVAYTDLTKQDVEVMLEDQIGEDEIARLTDNLKIQLQQVRDNQVTTAPPPWLTKA